MMRKPLYLRIILQFGIIALLILAGWAISANPWGDVGSTSPDPPRTLLQEEIDNIVSSPSFEPLKIGEEVPDFDLAVFNEAETVRLSDYHGKKAVILNFWASWCSFCITEMPILEKFHQDYGDQATVIGVNLQESYLDTLKNFVDAVGVTYPILLDPNSEAKKAFRVVVQPQTFFIDKEGILRDVHYGPFTVKQLLDKGHKITEPL